MWLLENILGQPLVPAISAIRSEWITKRNFLGSYSLFTMNAAHHRVSPSELAEPVYNANGRARIFFAGEATSALFSGYTNGAVETGFRASDEVLEVLEYANGGGRKMSNSLSLLIITSITTMLFALLKC